MVAINTPSIRGQMRKVLPFLIQAQEQSLNEADTVRRVVKVLSEVLGYDDMNEITRETVIKGKYVDIGIKLDGVLRLLVEVKAAGTPLRDRHIDQARSYAAEGNIRWVVLTNGTVWHLYHLTFEEGIEHDLVFSIDVAGDDFDNAADLLAVLHRDSVRKDLHEELWRMRTALSPQSMGRTLFTENVIRLIRRELRRAEGISIDEEDLVAGIKNLFSIEAREQMGPIKIRRRKRKRTSSAREVKTQEQGHPEEGGAESEEETEMNKDGP
ncbi:MAG TPA: type I restriction enzyme HsdR N-terminal domain-containing protein [Terriglobia bacterium]|nr:type I restriction enzyme HsdR N-terminal domain-containing protein [Terriglobia bacterium]